MDSNKDRMACHCYVGVGYPNFRFNDGLNVYINATGLTVSELSEKISFALSEKKAAGISVSNKILFLVPGLEFHEKAQNFINALQIQNISRIQVFPIKNQEVKFEEPREPKLDVISGERRNGDIQSNGLSEHEDTGYKPELRIVNSEPKHKYSFNHKSNGLGYKGVGSTGLVKSSGAKVRVLRPRDKSAAFVSLPVIMFVLSALLLIGSIVLLFILD